MPTSLTRRIDKLSAPVVDALLYDGLKASERVLAELSLVDWSTYAAMAASGFIPASRAQRALFRRIEALNRQYGLSTIERRIERHIRSPTVYGARAAAIVRRLAAKPEVQLTDDDRLALGERRAYARLLRRLNDADFATVSTLLFDAAIERLIELAPAYDFPVDSLPEGD